MKKRKILRGIAFICIFVLCLGTLSGCGEKEGQPGGLFEAVSKEKDLPEDPQWNHGISAIMETEAGYFSNDVGLTGTNLGYQSLRYYDKASGETILLCNKPECSHRGSDSCEATYKNVRPISCVLYEDSIYELAAEENGVTISINLYKAALDGSAFDKVGCVISAENEGGQEVFYKRSGSAQVYVVTNQQPDYSFIIHKGFAYIPYYLQFGKGMMGLKGSGLMKMNLQTGETEELYKVENLTDGTPCNVTGIGDYVYFLLSTSNSGGKTKRYDISTKEVESIKMNGVDEKGNVKEYEIALSLLTKDRFYSCGGGTTGEHLISAYDAKTREWLESESFPIKTTEGARIKAAFFYDGKLFIGDQEKAWFYDLQGNLLAQVEAPSELIGKGLSGKSSSQYYQDYKISNGKLYYVFSDMNEDMSFQMLEGIENPNSLNEATQYVTESMLKRHVYACSLEDVFQGKGTWSEVYVTQGR